MKILLEQVEIEDALRNHILSNFRGLSEHNIEIDFTAGRGERGLIAEVNLTPKPTEKEVTSTEGVTPKAAAPANGVAGILLPKEEPAVASPESPKEEVGSSIF